MLALAAVGAQLLLGSAPGAAAQEGPPSTTAASTTAVAPVGTGATTASTPASAVPGSAATGSAATGSAATGSTVPDGAATPANTPQPTGQPLPSKRQRVADSLVAAFLLVVLVGGVAIAWYRARRPRDGRTA